MVVVVGVVAEVVERVLALDEVPFLVEVVGPPVAAAIPELAFPRVIAAA